MRLTTIELAKEDQKFSIAHFTLFSEGQRERLHGHNYHVTLTITAPVASHGMTFNYQMMKQKLRDMCRSLNEYTVLPGKSNLIKIQSLQNKITVTFGNDEFVFPKSDVLILPIANSTVEEFSQYILDKLCEDKAMLDQFQIQGLTVGVASGPGQTGYSQWARI